MPQEFQARASLNIADVSDPFVPSLVGVGTMSVDDHPVAAVYLEGCFVDEPDRKGSFVVALDPERTAGLVAQLSFAMTDLGVPGDEFEAMLVEANRRIEQMRAMDRAPTEDS